MSGGGEAAHVDADLSDHDLGGASGDAGNRGGERNAELDRAELLLDRLGEPVDVLIEEVEVLEDRADHERVVRLEATLQGFAQRGDLGAQPALGEVGQHLGIGGAADERVEHRATGDAEDVGRDAVELDPGVLKRLVQPVGLALALLDLGLAIASERSQRPLRPWRHEAPAQSPASIG